MSTNGSKAEMPTGPWADKDLAAEAGRRSGEVRRRRRDMTPEQRALDAIGAKLGRLSGELLDAALGEGDFVDLKPETRLTAILRALEWKLGKAPTAKPQVEEKNPAIPTSDSLFG